MARYQVSGLPGRRRPTGRLVGIVTNRDLRLNADPTAPVRQYMTSEDLVTARPGTTLEQARDRMQEFRVEKLPIVDDDGLLYGLFTFKDVEKVVKYPHSAKDDRGRLLAAAAIGNGADGEDRAAALVEAGVDLLAVDSAHGHSATILEFAAKLKDRHPDVVLMVGNVATADAVRACRRPRRRRGQGRRRARARSAPPASSPASACPSSPPSWTAPRPATSSASPPSPTAASSSPATPSRRWRPGATAIMVGNLLAGTDESPGDLVTVGGRRYKEYRGMGSLDAMRAGSADRYFQGTPAATNARRGVPGPTKLVPEGVSGLLPYRGPLGDVTGPAGGWAALRHGLPRRARRCAELHDRAAFVRSPPPGRAESHVHDLDIVHESPNYEAPRRS